VCGLPLGDASMTRPGAAMVNLLGDLWDDGEPRWAAALDTGRTALHLYGKTAARPGRKMGHVTSWDERCEAAALMAIDARERLTRRG
jgi:5-(carboxyamino)imidazole ribonucleotide synthase